MLRWITIAGAVVLIPLIVVLGAVKLRDDEATTSANELPVVLSVDGYQVTEREYWLKVDAVESNVDYMQSVAATDAPFAAFDDVFATLIRETGVDNVALAGIISEAAVYQWGVDHGLEVSQAELDAALNEQREFVATGDGPSVAMHREFISKVGDGVFWDEIMPRELRYELMAENVRELQIDDSQSTDAEQVEWEAFQRQVVRDASVESRMTDLISQTMVEQAIQYITEDYPAFQAEHPQQ